MADQIRRAKSVTPAGRWPVDRQVATITLSHHDRHRRRIQLSDDMGGALLLDLAEAQYLADGDGLTVADGYVCVIAAEEDVCDIITDDTHQAARIAWHIGNRHVPLQIVGDCHLRIQYDHVLAEMIAGLGAKAVRADAPFNPEQGAYSGGHAHD